MSRKVRLIIFDAGDILYKTSSKAIDGAVKKFLNKHGILDLEKSNKIWKKFHKLGLKGKLSWFECQKLWIKNLGLPENLIYEWRRIDLNEIWKKGFTKFPNVNRYLYLLRKRGFKLSILSDSMASEKEKKMILKRLGIKCKYFDKIFTSHDIGCEKPCKKAYLSVLKHFNVKPKEAVFVGHDKEEIVGAKKLRLITISFGEKVKEADFYAKNWKSLYQLILTKL